MWTFHLWQEYVDFASYMLNLSYSSYDLAQHLDGQPLQVGRVWSTSVACFMLLGVALLCSTTVACFIWLGVTLLCSTTVVCCMCVL